MPRSSNSTMSDVNSAGDPVTALFDRVTNCTARLLCPGGEEGRRSLRDNRRGKNDDCVISGG